MSLVHIGAGIAVIEEASRKENLMWILLGTSILIDLFVLLWTGGLIQ